MPKVPNRIKVNGHTYVKAEEGSDDLELKNVLSLATNLEASAGSLVKSAQLFATHSDVPNKVGIALRWVKKEREMVNQAVDELLEAATPFADYVDE